TLNANVVLVVPPAGATAGLSTWVGGAAIAGPRRPSRKEPASTALAAAANAARPPSIARAPPGPMRRCGCAVIGRRMVYRFRPVNSLSYGVGPAIRRAPVGADGPGLLGGVGCRIELQGRGVDAVAQPGRVRAIVEHVAKVPAA